MKVRRRQGLVEATEYIDPETLTGWLKEQGVTVYTLDGLIEDQGTNWIIYAQDGVPAAIVRPDSVEVFNDDGGAMETSVVVRPGEWLVADDRDAGRFLSLSSDVFHQRFAIPSEIPAGTSIDDAVYMVLREFVEAKNQDG